MTLSPITKRRIQTFKANRRGYISAIVLLVLFAFSACAELIANDKPLLVYYKGELLFPIVESYREDTIFGGALESEADYNDPWVIHEIASHGWMLRAPIPFSYTTINFGILRAPAPPSSTNFFGTDDQARDVFARVLYGFRLSMCFAMLLVFFSSVIGIAVGALSG
jgi:microcin C transport system permease protein